MLIEFRTENHRSLRDEQVLTMAAGRGGDADDPRIRKVRGFAEPLLPVAAIYGANASGKTNILSALAFMKDAVTYSHRSWAPDGGIPRDPFAWGKKDEPSLFEVTVLVDSVRYQYGFVADNQSIVEEWLYAWPHGKKQVWYERDHNRFKFGGNLKGENKRIEEITRPNSLFLSAAVQLKHTQLSGIFYWFGQLRAVHLSPNVWPLVTQMMIVDLVAELHDPQDQGSLAHPFLAMLRNADLGIVDVDVDIQDHGKSRGLPHVRCRLKHKSSHGDAWLPLEQESHGTCQLFQMGIPILQCLKEGSVLIIDELESRLHPSLALEIVNLFNDPQKNPRNAQLVFTTHDTNLLGTTRGEPVLRRDQIWLTEKDSEGATILYPLTDYKPRNSENLERGYLQGRYGAIPFLGNFGWGNEASHHDQTPRQRPKTRQTPSVSGSQASAPDRV